jgi:uncharacterized membrane protein
MTIPGIFVSIIVFRNMLFSVPGAVFWPYFSGIAILLIGLAMILRSDKSSVSAIDKALLFGPVFFASPMAVFGGDHFMAPQIVAAMVPSWIPGHLFWTYLVGTALIAAALSMVTNKYSTLAATLLGLMIFSFVLLIHVPNFAAKPGDRILFAVLIRDLSFSAGALAFAVAHAQASAADLVRKLTPILRSVIAVTTVFFGVEHFLHPQFVPVVPLTQLMPAWIPAHLFLSYVTGTALIAAGLSILVNWRSRSAATWLGVIVFALVLLVYLPIMIAKPSDIGNGLNYFADTLAFSGAALLLAGALVRQEQPTRDHKVVAVEQRTLETFT